MSRVEGRPVLVVALISFVIATVSGTCVGVRLLLAARRNRQLPELSIGVATLTQAVGAIGMLIGARIAVPGSTMAAVSYAGGLLVVLAGHGFLGVGIWRIFRPESRIAPVAVALLCVEMGTAWLAVATSEDPFVAATSQRAGLWLYLGRIGFYAWASAECLRYHDKLRRRLRLGLADPVITHQIALWGISALAMTGIFVTSLATAYLLSRPVFQWPPSLLLVSALGTVGAVGIWLAFFPPEAYRRRICAAHPETA